MNQSYPYPIPGAQADPNSFVADNTGQLGDVDQPLDGRTLVTVDYSQLVPAVTLVGYSFRVSPGGEPQLWITKPQMGTATLSFTVEGGIGGTQYEVMIVATTSNGVRSDVLNVNVLGDGCGCSTVAAPPYFGDATSSDGSVLVNTAPRFFVSAWAPVAPNVLDRWYDTTNEVVFDYISNGLFTSWVVSGGSSGGGGGGGGGSSTIRRLNPITPDGAKVSFSLTATDGTTVAIAGDAYLMVSLDGVWQEPTYQYSATGNVVVFAQAPTVDAHVFMLWFSGA